MGEVFGVVPDDYIYNYVLWNDSNVTIHSSQQGQTSFMGGTFTNAYTDQNVSATSSWLNSSTAGTIIDGLADSNSTTTIQEPDYGVWGNTPGTLTVTAQHLMFNLYFSDNEDTTTDPLYESQLTVLSEENTTKVYHYRAYTSRELSGGSIVHVPKVELMGWTGAPPSDDDDSDDQPTVTISSSLTSMSLINSTSDDITVSFTYASNPFTVTLEARTFNTISVADGSSLRPNTFSFYESGSSTPFTSVDFQKVGFDGHSYTMEVYQDSDMTDKAVCLQGLSVGDYDMPLTNQVRDISPVQCTCWWQSKEQYADANDSSDDTMASFLDLPGQLWAVYESDDTPILTKISVGEAISWNMLRPKVSEGGQYIYFLYVQASSDDAAKSFASEFISGTMGDDLKSVYTDEVSDIVAIVTPQMLSSLSSDSSTTLTTDQETQAISGTLDYTFGAMTDASGTVGYLVGADYFGSTGVGGTAQYYKFTPSVYNLTSLENAFKMYLTNTSDTTLASDLPQWIINYVEDADTVKGFIENLLITDGNSSYVENGELNDAGNLVVEGLLTGPVSIQNPSLDMSTMQNMYVYGLSGSAPDGMPDATAATLSSLPSYSAQG